jgi:predicted NAD/FAD-binding protein
MKIAVIGGGISGMLAAYLLCEEHQVTVYEANDYIGGHTNTIEATVSGRRYALDTGFIVFNQETYPNFIKLMRRLNVPYQPSDMSFSVSCDETGLEYRATSLDTLFAQRRNLLNGRFLRMILEILRFRRESGELLAGSDPGPTLGDYLRQRGYSRYFIEKFIIPMGAAVWSAVPDRFQEFPASAFVRFFTNHGMLRIRNQPQWYVIKGGSQRYVEALTRPYRDRIRLRTPVAAVHRHPDRVVVTARDGAAEAFDQVVIAAHSDQALTMLADPSAAEREILAAIPYQENRTVLHTDDGQLPKTLKARASWNYRVPVGGGHPAVVTYSLNRLQSIDAPHEFCVTLNSPDTMAANATIYETVYHHPVYDSGAFAAQQRWAEVNGVNRTWFCGAYWGYGFHEDGVKSALAVCGQFGKTL